MLLLPIGAAWAGEFDNACVMGLAEGKRIKTDCSITWSDTDGKVYCFATQDSKAHFLKDPTGNLRKAKERFAAGTLEEPAADMNRFGAADVTAFVEATVGEAAAKNAGAFKVNDSMLGQTLLLEFEKVDFVRTLHGYGFFANSIFHAKDNPQKRYQIDFWVKPQGGQLAIIDTRIYKAPRKEGDKYVLITRQPKPWWWIPASEHPGESEVKRGWEIMSAIEEHIIAERARSGGVYKLKDEKTGEEIDMDFVGLHQPVRRLKEDGRYFACSDFRKAGSNDQYYDVDFWLDEKDGRIRVGSGRLHKVPVLEDGSYIQMPRYQFDPKTFEVVP